MSAKLFLAVLLFSCSVINSSTMSLSIGANFLALLLNLMGLVVLVDCFGDGGNGDGRMLIDHNLCYLFYFGRAVKVLHRHLVQGGLLVVLQQHQIYIWPPSEFFNYLIEFPTWESQNL
jgi:hypothetical protein